MEEQLKGTGHTSLFHVMFSWELEICLYQLLTALLDPFSSMPLYKFTIYPSFYDRMSLYLWFLLSLI